MPDRYRIVFAVVSDRPEDLTLPFFSRLNLRHAFRTLQAYGYKAAIAIISVNETLASLVSTRLRFRLESHSSLSKKRRKRTATVVIKMFKSEKPANLPGVLSARELMDNLQSQYTNPKR